jgi:hypothetical protein
MMADIIVQQLELLLPRKGFRWKLRILAEITVFQRFFGHVL